MTAILYLVVIAGCATSGRPSESSREQRPVADTPVPLERETEKRPAGAEGDVAATGSEAAEEAAEEAADETTETDSADTPDEAAGGPAGTAGAGTSGQAASSPPGGTGPGSSLPAGTTPPLPTGTGPPGAPLSDDEISAIVQRHLDTMTLRQQIAQRFIVFVPRNVSVARPASLKPIKQLLVEEQPAGLILYRWNYGSLDEARRLTGYFQNIMHTYAGGRELLICADQEGGRVAALRFPHIVRVPSAFRVGSYRDPEFVEAVAYVTAVQMREAGLNMNLAPVLDLTDVPDNGIIGDRSYGPDPQFVSAVARAYVQGFRRAGVVATAKHFPGHGVTQVDSHGRLPSVSLSLDDLQATHMQPFSEAIDAGVPAVMTAHILFPGIDPDYPATISRVFLQDVLRQRLGFQGVVISDGLEMGALADNYDLDLTLQRALRLGVDLVLLYSRYNLTDVINRVESLMADGRITQRDITDGVRRVLELKARYGLLR